jgi:hypothetical protein
VTPSVDDARPRPDDAPWPVGVCLYGPGAAAPSASALSGGEALPFDPSGSVLGLPVGLSAGTPFADSPVPGPVPFTLFGVGAVAVRYGAVHRTNRGWPAAVGLGQVGWTLVQVWLVGVVDVLHAVYGGLGLLLAGLAVVLSVRADLRHGRGASRWDAPVPGGETCRRGPVPVSAVRADVPGSGPGGRCRPRPRSRRFHAPETRVVTALAGGLPVVAAVTGTGPWRVLLGASAAVVFAGPWRSRRGVRAADDYAADRFGAETVRSALGRHADVHSLQPSPGRVPTPLGATVGLGDRLDSHRGRPEG